MTRSPNEVAEMLQLIMTEKFAGKTETRYQISRERLAQLSDRKTLRLPFLEELHDACLDLGLLFIDLDTTFAIQELSIVRNYRNVPPYIIAKLTGDTR